jgi:hypothetical protein
LIDIVVTDIQELENGDSLITFDMDHEATRKFAEIGMRLVLYSAVAGKTTEEVLQDLIKDLKDDEQT